MKRWRRRSGPCAVGRLFFFFLGLKDGSCTCQTTDMCVQYAQVLYLICTVHAGLHGPPRALPQKPRVPAPLPNWSRLGAPSQLGWHGWGKWMKGAASAERRRAWEITTLSENDDFLGGEELWKGSWGKWYRIQVLALPG